MLRSLRSFITLILLLTTISGAAQSVGVVMSGGGAKGLYHIGVLQALEERGIPIDYVAGTSMGSIVAGLYAAGYSPAEMRDIVTSGEIESWLSGRIDSSYGAYYRQYRTIPSLFSLRIDTKNLLSFGEEIVTSEERLSPSAIKPQLYLPNSLISSTQVDLTLTRLFAAASASSDDNFDNLMIPFLCVASDMRNNQAVTLTDGDLGESIRASMAIPVAFNPVKRDSMLLYDGGIFDNFPWRPLAERHNPDIIIGSICTGGNTELTEQSSLVDQVFVISTQKSDYDMPEGNPTIQRDVPAGMLDFAGGEWIIDMGYADAMKQMQSIEATIPARRDSAYYDNRRAEWLTRVKPLIFEEYEVNGLTTEQNLYVRDFLHTSDRHNTIIQREMPFEELQDNLYRILSNGDFTTEYPTVKYNPESERYKLYINLETKPEMKLSVGGHISSTAFNQLLLSLNYQQVKRVAQTYNADLFLGTVASSARIGGRTDFYLNSPLFLDYYFSYSSLNLQYNNLGNITDVTNSQSVKTRDSHFSIGGGIPLSRRSLLTLRANVGWNYYYYDTPDYSDMESIDPSQLYDRTRLAFGATKLEYQRSTLDRLAYPTRGSKLELSAVAVIGRERNYQSLFSRSVSSTPVNHKWLGGRLQYEKYFMPPSDSWFSLGFNLDMVYTTLEPFGNPTASMLMLPAYQPVTHSEMIFMPDFSANKYVGVGVIPIFNVAPDVLLRTGAYAMFRNNYNVSGAKPDLISREQLHYIGEATIVYNSSLGALSLSLTKYDVRDWDNLYLTFGFGVPIFAPKGIFY